MPYPIDPDERITRPAHRAQRIKRRLDAAPSSRGRTAGFRERVWEILRCVPRGRVVTYGQLALLAGHPRAARQVGWIAHAGGPQLPWQRVVNRAGGLASGYDGGRAGHQRALQRDGVRVRADLTVDLRRYQWWPNPRTSARLRLPDEVRAIVVSRSGGAAGQSTGPGGAPPGPRPPARTLYRAPRDVS
ncbi:MAG TPA: MGMT family protein [bacterium]|nr:MGMT family protein [bacterium]